jgi:two-component system sensor histidine kinase PilS (NtrC family)
VRLSVADTGSGMDEQVLEHIFEPFFTTKANGTGLGLSIVHRILEAYDCRLDVDSALGQGTTFSLHFRQIEEPARPAN